MVLDYEKMMTVRLTFLAVGLCALSQVAYAAPKAAPAAEPTYEKKTVINFEDDTISGDLTRPDGEYVEGRKKVQHSNLIRVREEFRGRVLQSVGEL
jgi:hypothetical protein